MYILSYDCMTAAGPRVENLMTALYEGQDCSTRAPWGPGKVCQIKGERFSTVQETLSAYFETLWSGIENGLPSEIQAQLKKSRVGLVFASTKGFIEDFIWTSDLDKIRHEADPFNQLIEVFCQSQCHIQWTLSCNISNACASSHVSLEYIQDLFTSDRLDYAILIGADLIGPFVFKGFSSLKLISQAENRPFSGDRDGLQLGEAVTMVLLSKDQKASDSIKILNVSSDTEGSSITRPSVNGLGLVRAFNKIHESTKINPDLVIAHGTGTRFNDQAEDLALFQFLNSIGQDSVPVTNTKWSIGHTLGASGSVDLISACEIIKRQKVFNIENTKIQDPELKMTYLTPSLSAKAPKTIKQVLISSLGFGGVHAALMITSQGDVL